MNAYSEDVCEKIVQALHRGMGKSDAARTFSVSLSSIKRYAKLADERGARPEDEASLPTEDG
jgi:transposase